MMDFLLENKRFFSINGGMYYRVFSVMEKRDGTLIIRNVMTGEILFDNLNIAEITIDGNPLTNPDDLQKIIYNFSCVCDAEESEMTQFRIFDYTFDNTFE